MKEKKKIISLKEMLNILAVTTARIIYIQILQIIISRKMISVIIILIIYELSR